MAISFCRVGDVIHGVYLGCYRWMLYMFILYLLMDWCLGFFDGYDVVAYIEVFAYCG